MTPIPLVGLAEPFSALSHLLAAAVALTVATRLVLLGPRVPGHAIALAVFGAAVAFQLAMSGAYHLLPLDSAARGVLRVLDHAAIFALIAAAFTRLHAIVFRGPWRWGMLALIWGLAVTAIALKSAFFGTMPEWAGLVLYLAMGWLGLVSAIALLRHFGLAFIAPLAWGAAAYTASAVLDFAAGPVVVPGVAGAHELFHVAVLAGIVCYWRFVARIAPGHLVHGRPICTTLTGPPPAPCRTPRRQYT